ncbi:MAG: Asp-tRNA(Asn)/Glu-tRNA(Gln) amidotransferase subunit GatA [Treponema sp.]|nr:Asp-tRNA(Asn)/Glu-tRNA(Gln) amidotransferase subunit GatA [Treponema sp.]
MKREDLLELSALDIASGIKAKKFSVPEVVNTYIDNIEKNDKQYNAFLTIAKESAVKRASEIQLRIDKGEDISPLAGVPISLKDNISTEGIETNCASKMLSGFKPVYNAAIVEKLESAGLIIIGKNNMDEFALGGSSETGAFGAVKNPWDLTRTAGGSSGGSAAAVAAGEIPLAIATDTGGSIRQPSSFCGITGIKPTYGAVSRFGINAAASSLDQAGPMAYTIEDCAALLSIISGPDKRDSTCSIKEPFKFDLTSAVSESAVKGLKIGLLSNIASYTSNACITVLNDEVKTAVSAASKELEAAGAVVESFEISLMDYFIPTYLTIAAAEVSSNFAKFDGLKYGYRSSNAKTLSEVYRLSRAEGFGLEVKRRIMFGSFALSAGQYDVYYKKALQARMLIRDTYKKLFERFDLILSPVTPTTAFELGKKVDNPMDVYMGDIFTAAVNLAGLPAASLPCGFDKQGLPIGFQLIGNAFTENKLIDVGRVYQSRTGYHNIKFGKHNDK